jgi:maltose alpha-D-glucosyltransferase / alpha-amylase
MSFSYWYQNAVYYELYVRAYYDSNGDGHGDLNGLTQKLDYLKELGIDCLWLLPIYPSPLKDDGYDISDYCNIHPDYGTLDDFAHLLKEGHSRGIRIITDLVMNHTSDAHPWFQAARVDRNSPYRAYYVWSDTDHKFADARIIFLDTEKSNWTWDPVAAQYYWHRFYPCQPDLNFENPRVQEEMLNVMKFWLDLGVDGFRVDAAPYLFEREGTNCENLPETHAYLKHIRNFVDQNYPGRVLLCEANQWPKDVRAYLGDGDEFHMAFHFPLMPRIFKALRQSSSAPIHWAIENTPAIPDISQWCIFLRNHDELTLEMVSEEDRQWMWKEYAPDPHMRLNLGIRRRLAPLLDNDPRTIKLANSLLFTLPGSPILYYGDEIGMGDNIWLPDRNGLRTPMQWDASASAGFSHSHKLYAPIIETAPYDYRTRNVANQMADPDSAWNAIHKMILVRKNHSAFAKGEFIWLDCRTEAVLAYSRGSAEERILLCHNLSPYTQTVSLKLDYGMHELRDLLTGQKFQIQKDKLSLMLEPYQYFWLT